MEASDVPEAAVQPQPQPQQISANQSHLPPALRKYRRIDAPTQEQIASVGGCSSAKVACLPVVAAILPPPPPASQRLLTGPPLLSLLPRCCRRTL